MRTNLPLMLQCQTQSAVNVKPKKRRAIASEKIQAAKAMQEAYMAEKEAEIARAEREKATQEADILVLKPKLKRRDLNLKQKRRLNRQDAL